MASHPEAGTSAVDETYLETLWINNRLFQKYAITNQTYYGPMDDDEIERLHLENNVLDKVFDNRLIFAPLSRPRRILDCGYGTSNWASQVADQFPRCEVRILSNFTPTGSIWLATRINGLSCEGVRKVNVSCLKVIGIDINPAMQPVDVPENLYLQIDDLNRRFTFQANNFDLVHSQMMASGIHANRWTQYLRDMYRVTRGSGWCQLVELYYNVQSDNGSLTDAHALQQWSANYLDSMNGLKDLRVPLRLPNLMRDAGFVDVEHRMIPLHTCGWSTKQWDYDIGLANRENVQRMLSSLAIYPFTERLEMSLQDVHLLIAQARLEADDPALKAYFPLYVCIGRKPRTRR